MRIRKKEELAGAKVLVVLGHTSCGAVKKGEIVLVGGVYDLETGIVQFFE